MHNIASIYRFNTPFLDLPKEKESLISVIKKIEKSIEIDWIKFSKETIREWNYYKISLVFSDDLWVIYLYYIFDVSTNSYHLPIFKLKLFLNQNFLLDNEHKQNAVKFLNNIFECFDWLTEKEFLIDLDNSFYYTTGIFKTKIYPNYDFSDIEKIRESFEASDWMVLVEDFINEYSDSSFELSYEKSEYFYKLYSIFLYFIYLVFLMHENIVKTKLAEEELNHDFKDEQYNSQKELIKQRLSYVEKLHNKTFEEYKDRLELFFKMF